MVKTAIILSFLFFSSLITCNSQDEFYFVETIDGVRYVHNIAPQWGNESKIALKFVQEIGGMDDVAPNEQFFGVSDLTCGLDGNIFILDSGNFRIQKFDSKGKFMLTIGRKGNGPGELIYPLGITIDQKSTIYVADSGNNRIQKFTSNGEAAGSFRTVGGVFQVYNTLRRFKSGNIMMPFTPNFDFNNWKNPKGLIEIMTDEGEIIRTIGIIHDSGDNSLNYFINATHFDSDSQFNIYVNFLYLNRIDKYSPEGELLFSVDRPVFYEIINAIEYESRDIQGELTKIPKPALTLVSAGMGIDNEDRIWVITPEINPGDKKINTTDMEPGDLFVLDVFNNEGILLCRIPAPRKFNYLRIFGDRLFLFDNIRATEYRIIEI